ncbi:MAG: DUF2252 domain-containing protein [Acidobacteriia bacterium]|nr:DUF2252 domain-containing protein [Terriglobia bacterium]
MRKDIVERIQEFNATRDPDLLKIKYQHMRASSFGFYRGTCHIFYEDWPKGTSLDHAPAAWISGDLHLENFGSYKGDNRLVYFDLNDFDEAVLAPCTWELARFLTSILVAAETLTLRESEGRDLQKVALEAYVKALQFGKARTVEIGTAEGMVRELLDALQKRKRKNFLDKRTKLKGKHRQIFLDGKKFFAVSGEERARVEQLIKKWAARQADPAFFNVIDVAHRIAGTGSLGLYRFAVLVRGKGSPDHNFLLDLKEAAPSSIESRLKLRQPKWRHEADRVVSIQQRVQGTSPALLSPVEMHGRSYILHELQPLQDKVNLRNWNGKLKRLEKLVATMGELAAWGQLRSSGRQGSSTADELMAFANQSEWQGKLLDYSSAYAHHVFSDYKEFYRFRKLQ